MSKILQSIFENEEMQNYISENEEILNFIDENSDLFAEKIKAFILAHPSEFIGESVEETKKRILTFSEMATAQYMKEMVGIASLITNPLDSVNETTANLSLNDYL